MLQQANIFIEYRPQRQVRCYDNGQTVSYSAVLSSAALHLIRMQAAQWAAAAGEGLTSIMWWLYV